ncbi:MAG: 4-hydroxy-3-methylbut-2-enyl diphosphate reductase [Lachnospiraceae bacterium]|nr:4-hydroxy-3-methylbut-2-enyl diphosphate reductase [Lachnospiraceae bacterium]
MKVEVAKSAGFCFGVKRAVDIVNDNIKKVKDKPIYTYGPIIHNEEVVEDLKRKGVMPIEEGSDLSKYEPGIVIIRSHGVAKSVQDELVNAGFEVIDASCPFVKKIHKTVADKSNEGYYILIVGNPNHPEVEGIVGWVNGNDVSIISSPEDAHNFSYDGNKKICIVSQTTYNFNKFQENVEIIKEKGYDIIAVNTICNATFERQEEAKELSAKVDLMVVVGGKHSSNTQKLYDICCGECSNTYFVQTKDDLDLTIDQSIDYIGITAGASTPNNIIEEVQTQCQKVLNKC